jgi:hypothetical protein
MTTLQLVMKLMSAFVSFRYYVLRRLVAVCCCEFAFKLSEAEPLAETETADGDPYIADLFLDQDFVCHSS